MANTIENTVRDALRRHANFIEGYIETYLKFTGLEIKDVEAVITHFTENGMFTESYYLRLAKEAIYGI